MSEIRFRIWDTETRKMRTNLYLWSGKCPAELVPLLSTNMKDKNGVEIYEGDIVEEVNHSGEKTRYKVIRDSFQFEVIDLSDSYKYYLHQLVIGDMVVVGNIYENPELLNPEPELKPCPFCGNTEPKIGEDDALDLELIEVEPPSLTYFIACLECRCRLEGFSTRKDLHEEWNRRVVDDNSLKQEIVDYGLELLEKEDEQD